MKTFREQRYTRKFVGVYKGIIVDSPNSPDVLQRTNLLNTLKMCNVHKYIEREREIAYLQSCAFGQTHIIKHNLVGLNRMWFSIYSPPPPCVCVFHFFSLLIIFFPLFNFTLICVLSFSLFLYPSSCFFSIEKLNVCTILTRIKTVCCLEVDFFSSCFAICGLFYLLDVSFRPTLFYLFIFSKKYIHNDSVKTRK